MGLLLQCTGCGSRFEPLALVHEDGACGVCHATAAAPAVAPEASVTA